MPKKSSGRSEEEVGNGDTNDRDLEDLGSANDWSLVDVVGEGTGAFGKETEGNGQQDAGEAVGDAEVHPGAPMTVAVRAVVLAKWFWKPPRTWVAEE